MNLLGVITAIGILYGMGMSTYNFFVSRSTKKRRLKVMITRGDKDDGSDEIRGRDLIFINVINPGYMSVMIKKPYFKLPGDTIYEPPRLLSDVSFPYELHACQYCSVWIKESDVMEFYTKGCGLQGEVQLWGVVRDATGKEWKSKEWHRDKELTKEREKFEKQYFGKINEMFQKRASRKSDRH